MNTTEVLGSQATPERQQFSAPRFTELGAEFLAVMALQEAEQLLDGSGSVQPYGIDLATKLPKIDMNGGQHLTRVSGHGSKGQTVWDND